MRYEGGCTTVVIGKKASATGHVLIGHNEDDDKSIVMVHSVPRMKHEEGEFVVAVLQEMRQPNGQLFEKQKMCEVFP